MSDQLKESKKSSKAVYDRAPRVKLFANSPLSAAGKRMKPEGGVFVSRPKPYLTKA